MLKCKELSRLPKAATGKYVNFRRQTPGCTDGHLNPMNAFLSNCLDPSHPATSVPKNKFPNVKSDILGIRAVPFATLSKPEQVWTTPSYTPFDTWTERVQRLLDKNANLEEGEERLEIAPIVLNNVKKNAIPMSLINATSKKRTSRKKHIRHKISSKLKVAINLIVSRGADVTNINGKPKLVMDENEAEKMSDKWVSPGWTYIFYPTLEIYRMPYHELIPLLRESLRHIYTLSQDFERGWASRATIQRTVSPTQSSYSTRIPAQTRKFHPERPFQKRGPTQITSRAYSTRRSPTTYSELAKGIVQGNCDDLKAPKEISPESPKRLYQFPRLKKLDGMPQRAPKLKKKDITSSKTTFESIAKPIIRLGDVTFPIHHNSPILENDCSKIISATRKDDSNITVLKHVRDDARIMLDKSREYRASKLKRTLVRRQIALQAQRRGPLGLDFIGFDSRPDPSHDPFKDVEGSPQPDESGPLGLDFIGFDSRPDPSYDPYKDVEGTPQPDESGPLGLEFIGFDSRPDPSYDPFKDVEGSPQPEESPTNVSKALTQLLNAAAILTKSADKSSNGSPSLLHIDDFLPLDPTFISFPHQFKPKVDLVSLNDPLAETLSLGKLLQAFDPFHFEQSDGSLIGTPTSPVSEPTSEPGTPSTLTTRRGRPTGCCF